jgi:hypothetical protein
MKTQIFTVLLSIAFLSAGAFAHAGRAAHISSWGASTAYKTQN